MRCGIAAGESPRWGRAGRDRAEHGARGRATVTVSSFFTGEAVIFSSYITLQLYTLAIISCCIALYSVLLGASAFLSSRLLHLQCIEIGAGDL